MASTATCILVLTSAATRTASITGAYVALVDAVKRRQDPRA